MNAQSNKPTRKVAAAGIGGAIATIVLALIPGAESPELAAAVATVCAFLLGYLVPEG